MYIENQIINNKYDDAGGITISGYHVNHCEINNSVLNNVKTFCPRSHVIDTVVENTFVGSVTVGPALIERCRFTNIQVYDLLIIWGTLFKHVTFTGNIGNTKINSIITTVHRIPDVQVAYDEDRIAFYKTIDWAIDISQAKCRDFEIEGIPAQLVRRDNETQAVVTHELLARVDGWEKILKDTNNYWYPRVSLFGGRTKERDCVLVAPIGSSKPKRDKALKGLKELRELGLVLEDK
jgi:hypothetical protein